jgi:hypothetical protein
MQGGEGAGGEDDQVSKHFGRQWVKRGNHHWPSKGVQTVLVALSVRRCSSLEEYGALEHVWPSQSGAEADGQVLA